MTIRLQAVILPVLLIGALQLGGCSRTDIKPPPPGGIYRSISAGATFDQSVQILDQPGQYIANFSLGEVFRSTTDPNLILIAAGPNGIVRSRDDGQNWEVITTPLANVADVVALPSGVLVAAATDGDGQGFVIRSLDDGVTWNSVYTVPIPQENQQFQVIGRTPPKKTEIVELELDPFNPDRVYAASTLGTIVAGEQSAKTWRALYSFTSPGYNPLGDEGQVGVRQLEASPDTPGELLLLTSEHALIRLNGNGQEEIEVPQYINQETPLFGGTEQKLVYDFTYIPGFAGAILIGVEDGVVVTRDGGQTWLELPIPLETKQEFNTVSVAVSPTNSNRLLVAVNHVWYRSEDGGASWITYTKGLSSFSITDLNINPVNASRVLAVLQPEKI